MKHTQFSHFGDHPSGFKSHQVRARFSLWQNLELACAHAPSALWQPGCLPSWMNTSSAAFSKHQEGNYSEGKRGASALAGIICCGVANCAVVAADALTAAPEALGRGRMLLPAVLSPASLVSSRYRQDLKADPGELGVLCSSARLSVPSAVQGQLPVIIKHVNDVTYPRGAGRAL